MLLLPLFFCWPLSVVAGVSCVSSGRVACAFVVSVRSLLAASVHRAMHRPCHLRYNQTRRNQQQTTTNATRTQATATKTTIISAAQPNADFCVFLRRGFATAVVTSLFVRQVGLPRIFRQIKKTSKQRKAKKSNEKLGKARKS